MPTSSREKPNVIWVKSLVPNEKNCASCAIWSAVNAPRGTSIMVPTRYLIVTPIRFHGLGGDAVDDRLLIAQLLHVADERDHDLRNDLEALLVQPARRFDDGARLHLGDLRVGDAEADAAMAEHRVELVQLLDALQQVPLLVELRAVLAGGLEPGDLHHELFALREELVERRVDGPDGHRRSRAWP